MSDFVGNDCASGHALTRSLVDMYMYDRHPSSTISNASSLIGLPVAPPPDHPRAEDSVAIPSE